MSHYKTNLDDLEFLLCDVYGVDRQWVGVLAEVERFAREVAAESFRDDSDLPQLLDGEVRLGQAMKDGWKEMVEAGWHRWPLSGKWGGEDIPSPVRWAGVELLVGANPALWFYAGAAGMAEVIGEEGSPTQWEKYGRRIVEDGWGVTMVLTEPDAGSDVGAGRTRAYQGEDGVWRIEGVKRFITSGDQDHTDNIVHLVLARPDGAAPGTKGLSLFLVPKYRINEDGSLGERNGVVVRNLEKKMGLKHSATCELGFGEDGETIGELLGGRHDGIRQMFEVIKMARMLIGVKATAGASSAYLGALAYAGERIQGRRLGAAGTEGPVPIIEHPDVRRMLINQKACVEGLRSLYLYVASLHDGGSAEQARAELLAPVLKGYAAEQGVRSVNDALQVFGGSGYLSDYPVEQYLRDGRIDPIYEGTTSIQALDLVFRKMGRDGGATLREMWAEMYAYDGAGSNHLREVLEASSPQMLRLMTAAGEAAGSENPQEVLARLGLEAYRWLETVAETVIAWLWCRQVDALGEREDPFAAGKRVVAAWWWAGAASRIRGRSETELAATGILELDPAGL